jgi:hypothetical protein
MKRIFPDAPLTSSQKNRRYYDNNRETALEKNKRYHQNNRKKIAKRHRLVAFRMTSEEHESKLREQDNKCAVCKQPFLKTPHIDHNHLCCSKRPTCGKCNRGLLCDDCNLGLGRFKDSIEVLTNAIQYLKEWKENGCRQ